MSAKMFCALLLVMRLGLPTLAAAQQPPSTSTPPPAPAPSVPPPSEGLTIFVLEGQNAVNDIRVPAAAMVVVEVRDENGKPVEGADVTFELPASGSGGAFTGQQHRFVTRTNIQGQAAATYTPNAETGRFTISVTATQANRTGSTMIRQANSVRPAEVERARTERKLKWWKVALIAGGAGAVIAVILLVTHGSSTPTVTVTPGRPTFGTP